MTSTSQRTGEQGQREQQQEATLRSIDETKENVKRAIEEARRETPRFAQTVTDFQNETADAAREVAETFLETQKDVVISMHSTWGDFADRTGYSTGSMMQPWNYFWWLTGGGMMSPMAMADLYVRMLTYMTMNFVVGTKITTNMMLAALDAARTTTRYAKDSSREMSRIMSMSVRSISRTTRETVAVHGETASSSSAAGAATSIRGETVGETGGASRRK
ncbi:MAG: hypothetical protein AB1351_08380 [Thermoproteota archaeon]